MGSGIRHDDLPSITLASARRAERRSKLCSPTTQVGSALSADGVRPWYATAIVNRRLTRIKFRRNSDFATRGLCCASETSSRNFKRGLIIQIIHFFFDIFPYRNIMPRMARAATTSDVFNAIAEPRRRQIVDL